MKIFLFKILLFLFPFIILESSNLTSVPYSDYNTPSSLINYLSNNKISYISYYSIFFQFASYIPIEESKKILGIMTSLYEFSGLYGIILILDKNSNITNISTYSDELLDLIEEKFNYKKENTYIIILQYDPIYAEEYENTLYINVGGKKAEKYLNKASREELINKWEKVLKIYNYTNFSKFYGDVKLKIFLNMNYDKDSEDSNDDFKKNIIPVDTLILMIFIIILIIGICIGSIIYARKRYNDKNSNTDEVDANSPLFK